MRQKITPSFLKQYSVLLNSLQHLLFSWVLLICQRLQAGNQKLMFNFLKITWLIIIYVILKGAEKKNDYLCRYFHCKINRWDAATNLLLVEKQRGVLRERERERAKYPYTKKRLSYWVEGGKETSARKVQSVSTSPQLHTESA